MDNQKQVGLYAPDTSTPPRIMKPELARRLSIFVQTGVCLIAGNFTAQALPGMHDWKVAFIGSLFVVITLTVLWRALRIDESDNKGWVSLFRFFRRWYSLLLPKHLK